MWYSAFSFGLPRAQRAGKEREGGVEGAVEGAGRGAWRGKRKEREFWRRRISGAVASARASVRTSVSLVLSLHCGSLTANPSKKKKSCGFRRRRGT